MKFLIRSSFLPIALIAIMMSGIVGCNRDDAPKEKSKSYDTKRWKKFDTPPGADPSVSDSLGGAGFEKLADKMGFVTFSPKPEELKFYGDANAKVGGSFRHIISRFLISFRPAGYGQNSNYVENQMISSLCYESLLGSNHLGENAPALATHWKVSDDKMTFTFRIDPNARFWNGKPVTAQDVLATFNLLMDETLLEPSNIMTYSKFEKPVALSKYIVQVKIKQLNWRNLLYFGGMSILSAEEIDKMTGKEFLDKYQYDMPVGSGEYIVLREDIVPGQSYSFTRRDDYWSKDYPMAKYSGNFDQINFDVVKDNPTLEYEKFKKGEQDYFIFTGLTTEKWVNDTTYDAVHKGWIQKRRIFTDGAWGTQGYAFNMRKPPFDDIRIRKAFAYLLNRDAIIEKLLLNEYEPFDTEYSNTLFENPNNEKVKFNPEKAAELLAEAGWKTKNADGLLTKNGKPFVVEIAIAQPLERFVTPYQQELKKAGIDLQVKFQDGSTMWKNEMERNFSMCRISWGGLQTPNPETSLHSKLADQKENNNLEGFKDLRVDALCAEYDTAFSKSAQIKIVQEIDGIAMQSFKNIYEWHPRGLRIGYWNKFGMPEYVYSRFTQFGNQDLTAMSMWWYDADKAKALEDAKKNGGTLPIAPVEVKYWKTIK